MYSPVEFGKESLLGVHDKAFDARLHAEPLELAAHQLVASHHRVGLVITEKI